LLPPLGWRQVDILPGDTLELLAALYGIPMEELRQGNCLPNGELQPGTFIFAPGQTPTPSWTATPTATPEPPQSQPSQAKKQPPRCGPPGGWVIYYVRRGDTLSRISVLTHTTVAQLQKANCLGSSPQSAARGCMCLICLPSRRPPAPLLAGLQPQRPPACPPEYHPPPPPAPLCRRIHPPTHRSPAIRRCHHPPTHHLLAKRRCQLPTKPLPIPL
jgi:LysM repeat protein